MDRAWMYGRRSDLFISEISKFIDVAKTYAATKRTRQIRCPCCDCENKKVWENLEVLRRHLI